MTDLQGQIERITYINEENGYTVAKVKLPGNPALVTVVGNLIDPVPGEVIQMRGEWGRKHRRTRGCVADLPLIILRTIQRSHQFPQLRWRVHPQQRNHTIPTGECGYHRQQVRPQETPPTGRLDKRRQHPHRQQRH